MTDPETTGDGQEIRLPAMPAPQDDGWQQQIAGRLREFDRSRAMIALARRARHLLPGDPGFGDPLSTAGNSSAFAACGDVGRKIMACVASSRRAASRITVNPPWTGKPCSGRRSGKSCVIRRACAQLNVGLLAGHGPVKCATGPQARPTFESVGA